MITLCHGSIFWHGFPLQELLEQYECLPRALEGNLVPCATDGHNGQAFVHLTPSTNLFKSNHK
jgi:hypothetical protein